MDRQRTALLAAVGHDLRTPLAGIKASVSSLRQSDVDWSDDERRELLATIEQSADRLEAVVHNLLDASRLQAGSSASAPRLVNLLDNALRHGGSDQPVDITAVAGGESAKMEIADHGPGVSRELQERLFEPFQRLDDSTTTGVGLGLTVARGFIEAMGGAMVADRTPGGGLTMRLRPPLAGHGGDLPTKQA